MGRAVEVRGTGRREPFGQRYGKARMPYGSGCLAGKRQRNAAGALDVETLAQGHARYTAMSWGRCRQGARGGAERGAQGRGARSSRSVPCARSAAREKAKRRAVRAERNLRSFCGGSSSCGRLFLRTALRLRMKPFLGKFFFGGGAVFSSSARRCRRAHYFRLTSDQDQMTRPTMHFCQSPSKSSMRLSTRGGLSAALSE